jgi:hypothetical protein
MEYKETIIDVQTGKITERPFTKSEIEAVQKETALVKKRVDNAEAEAQAKALAKADLLAKLGISVEEAALLLS